MFSDQVRPSECVRRVLVCGDRKWSDRWVIIRRLATFESGTVVIEGCSRGADRIAEVAATYLGFAVEHYPAQWKTHGRPAGSIRNQQMLDQSRPELVIAFHADIEKSKRTADLVRRARTAGIPVEIVTGN